MKPKDKLLGYGIFHTDEETKVQTAITSAGIWATRKSLETLGPQLSDPDFSIEPIKVSDTLHTNQEEISAVQTYWDTVHYSIRNNRCGYCSAAYGGHVPSTTTQSGVKVSFCCIECSKGYTTITKRIEEYEQSCKTSAE